MKKKKEKSWNWLYCFRIKIKKSFQLSVFIAALGLQNIQVNAQCNTCDIALAKDYMQYALTTQQQLNVLKVLDQQTFEELHKSGNSSGSLGISLLDIIGATISGSNDWNEFQQKRQKLFDLNSYNYSEAQAQSELRIVTNPIAYKYWSDCITKCYDNQPNTTKVYAYVTNADKDYIFIKVKYQANQISSPEVKCRITIDNGAALNEDAPKQRVRYEKSIKFKLQRQGDIGFTIKRVQNEENTVISISAEGADVFHEISKYQPPVLERKITGTLNYSYEQVVNEKVTSTTKTIRSPDLHNIKSGDKECRQRGGFGRGEYCAANNTITLPTLNDNEYYTNFSSVFPVLDNDGGCGWSMNVGLAPRSNISTDKTNASITFTTGSRDCTWGWSADIYQKQINIVPQNSPIEIKKNYFVVHVPDKAKAGSASILITIDGNSHIVKPGEDHPDKGIRFINSTTDGTNTNYEYFIQ